MRTIAVVTGTRAEYGLLKPVLMRIMKDEQLELKLIVTGTHLCATYGETQQEIVADGIPIAYRISNIIEETQKSRNVFEYAKAVQGFGEAFETLRPDLLVVLGDRYESLAAATTAVLMQIPIAHIAGGEVTLGAMDEQIRHSITKMSHLHFVSAKYYEENIKHLGEEAWRIFNVGDTGIEVIKNTPLLSQQELANQLGVAVDEETILATYHPVTLELEQVEGQITQLLKAFSMLNKKVIMTYPNADNGGEMIIKALNSFAKEYQKIYLFKSLGSLRYLSVMKHCGVVVGNSSSAIIEAPYLKKAVVNIGMRQEGRLKASNIIDVSYDTVAIQQAVETALSSTFKTTLANTVSLYGEGDTSEMIVKVLREVALDKKLLIKKFVRRD